VQNGVKKKIREIFRETRALIAMCIITKIVIWLLNTLGLCLRRIFGEGGGALQNICPGATSSHPLIFFIFLRHRPLYNIQIVSFYASVERYLTVNSIHRRG